MKSIHIIANTLPESCDKLLAEPGLHTINRELIKKRKEELLLLESKKCHDRSNS